MATPLRAQGAKSIANLKRGGTNRRPKKSVTDEARRISRKLLSDPAYRRMLNKRLRAGTIQPGVEALLYYYAYGKPKETIETTPPADIKIVHQYDDSPPTRSAPPKPPKPA